MEMPSQIYEKIFFQTFYENPLSESRVISREQTIMTYFIGVFCNFLLEIHLEEVLIDSFVSQECPCATHNVV